MSVFDPAEYRASRAEAARFWRAEQAEAKQRGGAPERLYAALCRWQAEQFERWTPLDEVAADRVGIVPYDLVLPPPPPPWDGPRTSAGCYATSWGWVHVKPACRCVR